jgi:hypothetical protein
VAGGKNDGTRDGSTEKAPLMERGRVDREEYTVVHRRFMERAPTFLAPLFRGTVHNEMEI